MPREETPVSESVLLKDAIASSGDEFIQDFFKELQSSTPKDHDVYSNILVIPYLVGEGNILMEASDDFSIKVEGDLIEIQRGTIIIKDVSRKTCLEIYKIYKDRKEYPKVKISMSAIGTSLEREA